MAGNNPLNLVLADMALQQGKAAQAQKMYADAALLYQRAIDLVPTLQPPRHLLGVLQAQQGRFDRAAQAFRDSLALDSNQAPVWQALAEAQIQLGLTGDAVNSLAFARGLLPGDAGVLDRLASALRDDGRDAEALQTWACALQIQPTNAQILCNYGNFLFKVDRVDEALAAYQKALQEPATRHVVLANRAQVLAQTGQLASALLDCDDALRLAPNSVNALTRRCEVLADIGQLSAAIDMGRMAVQVTGATVGAHVALANVLLRDGRRDAEAVEASSAAYVNLLGARYADNPDGVATAHMRGKGIAKFRLKHELEQAGYLHQLGAPLPGVAAFLDAARDIDVTGPGKAVLPSEKQLQAMLPYLRAPWQHDAAGFVGPCLNPHKDWLAVEQAYLSGSPELVAIDDFLSESALLWFRAFCLRSRVWQAEYKGNYLGAFAVNGFVSPVHLQLADELRHAMPQVFGGHELMHLWGFKYDAALGTGINMHADFALVNLNFWITPDEFNVNPDSGGMVVYDKPAPKDWSFHQYNSGGEVISRFLEEQRAKPVTIAYRCNRAVLFNSALFHETDHIDFQDVYQGRRINMTYLFGRQLR